MRYTFSLKYVFVLNKKVGKEATELKYLTYLFNDQYLYTD